MAQYFPPQSYMYGGQSFSTQPTGLTAKVPTTTGLSTGYAFPLGVATTSTETAVPTSGEPAPTGDVTGGGEPSGPSPWDILQQNWGSYTAELDNILNNLGPQREALKGEVGAQKESTLAELGLQLGQGQQQLEKEKTETKQTEAKSLKDIGASVAQAMKAGNIYLGNMGVTSPSAMNQYSYALSKIGSQERSNVKQNTANIMNEINTRAENLQNIYNTEKVKTEQWANAEISKISQWYYDAVRQIQTYKAQDKQALSQQILDQALSWLDTTRQYSMNKQQALDEWAINNAQNLEQVKANLAGVANYNPSFYSPQTSFGTPSVSGGNYSLPTGFGYSTEDQDKLFG